MDEQLFLPPKRIKFVSLKTKVLTLLYLMKTFKLILTFLFGALMVFGGVNHFLKPEMYYPFFPEFAPKPFLTYASGLLEILAGIAVFIPTYRKWGTLAILVLMLLFLPFHVWDVFSQSPAIGSHQAALIRLPIQFLFILWAWFIHKEDIIKH